MRKFKTLLFIALFSMIGLTQPFLVTESSAKETMVDEAEILDFAGTIEIIYADGTHIIIKTGEEIPLLYSGTIIRVIDGTCNLQIGDDVMAFSTGDLVRITPDAEGSMQEFFSPAKSARNAQAKNLSNTHEGSQSETGRDLIPLSPSTPQ